MALRQMVQATAIPVPPGPQDNNKTLPPAGERVLVIDPILTPDDGHFPMYESVMDPVHLNVLSEQQAPLS